MNNSLYFLLGWGAPIGAAIFAFVLVRSINRRDAGTEKMQQIAALIRSGAMAFLRTEYQWLAVFVAVMFVILVVFLPGNALWIGVSFLVGAVLLATVTIRERKKEEEIGGGLRTLTSSGKRKRIHGLSSSVRRSGRAGIACQQRREEKGKKRKEV